MKQKFPLTQLITLFLFFSILIFASCKKEQSQNGSATQQEEQASLASSESDVEAEMVFNGIFDDAIGVNNDVGMAGTGIFARSFISTNSGDAARVDACFTVTLSHLSTSSVFPIKVIIDFGTTGCVGPDGHVRRGKIINEYTSRLLYPGAIATTTFDGFYIDSIKVEGTHKITNTSSPNTQQILARQFTVEVAAKLSKANGNYTEWKSQKIIKQIEGLLTIDYPRDDIFQIEGKANGKAKKGSILVAWEAGTIEPLIKKFTCRWIVKGKVKTVLANNSANSPWVATLDFGGGDCDNKAIITINGVAHNITLR